MQDYLINSIVELNESKVIRLVNQALERGYSSDYILNAIELGMCKVGQLYEENSLFIADLMMAGIIFKEVLKLEGIRKNANVNQTKNYIGTIVIGSVRTDKHDIGKDIFLGIAKAAKLNVIDLGTDVAEESFVEAVKKYKPDILGMSALLTSATIYMKSTIDLLIKENLRQNIKIIVAGNPLSDNVCKYVGADAFTKKASEGLAICLNWIRQKDK